MKSSSAWVKGYISKKPYHICPAGHLVWMAYRAHIVDRIDPQRSPDQAYRGLFRSEPAKYQSTVVVSFTAGLASGADTHTVADVRSLVAVPWNAQRLRSLMELDAGGLKGLIRKEPPDVAEIAMPEGRSIYVVTGGGNHRVAAFGSKSNGTLDIHVTERIEAAQGWELMLIGGNFVAIKGAEFHLEFKVDDGFSGLAREILQARGAQVTTPMLNGSITVKYPFGEYEVRC